MTGDPAPGSCEGSLDDPEAVPAGPPEKMGRSFYAALALIGILVLMVVFLNQPAARANAGTVITETPWALRSYADATGTLVPVISGAEVNADFRRDGTLTGSAGCNRYAASYTTRDYGITVTNTSSTLMFCPGPGIMEQESAFLADLSGSSWFRVSGSSLKFYDASGKPVLVFATA